MIFHISLDAKTARFTSTGDLSTWTAADNRGYVNDGTGTNEDIKMTAQAKAALLNIVLGSVASFSPVISWTFITQEATSLNDVWDRLRAFYGFRRTGSKILELVEMKLQSGESRESLWERMHSFMESNLMIRGGSVRHEGRATTQNEGFTPTLQNMMTVLWLNILHPSLPALIRQHFATILRDNTLFSIRNEVSDAIPTLLEDIREKEGAINRAGGFNSTGRSGGYNSNQKSYQRTNFKRFKKKCSLCDAAGRSAEGHYLSSCPFLPDDDKKFLSRVRDIAINEDDCDDDEYDYTPLQSKTHRSSGSADNMHSSTRRVDVIPSPVLDARINSMSASLTLDCGAEANLAKESVVRKLGVEIRPTNQRANMADGMPMNTVGETHFNVVRDHHTFTFSGLVVKDLDCPILGGMPFLQKNDIYVRYSTNTIHFGDCCTLRYCSVKKGSSAHTSKVSCILKSPKRSCILPGESIYLPLPEELKSEEYVALEPRYLKNEPTDWLQCSIRAPTEGLIEVENSSDEPVILGKHVQFCQVRAVTDVSESEDASYPRPPKSKSSSSELYSSEIQLDPSGSLPSPILDQFHALHKEYDDVFSDKLGCYNGYSGEFYHTINVGSTLPPQRRGRIPIYNRDNKDILQLKFDELQEKGVLVRPEDVGVQVEYVHPSFLVKKSSGGHRLVTSFGQVAEFTKPQPTVTNNVEDVLQQVAQWSVIITADLKTAYYQNLLSKCSMKYTGVCTPYRGTLVYSRSVMGLPGSEAALEEILNRVLGDLIQQGVVAKLADDLYVGSDTVEGLLATWRQVYTDLVSMDLSFHRLKLSSILSLQSYSAGCGSRVVLGRLPTDLMP